MFCIRGKKIDDTSLIKHLAVYIHTAPRTTPTGGHAIQGGVQRPTIMSTTLTQSRVTRRAKIHQTQPSALRLRLGPRVVPSPARSSRRAYIHIQARPTVRHPACAMTSAYHYVISESSREKKAHADAGLSKASPGLEVRIRVVGDACDYCLANVRLRTCDGGSWGS